MSEPYGFSVWIGHPGQQPTEEITGLVSGITIEHGRRLARDDFQPPTATLKLKLDNTDAHVTADIARLKIAYRAAANVRITIDVPANQWQRLKDRLRRRHRWLGWIKVRTVQVTRYAGPIEPWIAP